MQCEGPEAAVFRREGPQPAMLVSALAAAYHVAICMPARLAPEYKLPTVYSVYISARLEQGLRMRVETARNPRYIVMGQLLALHTHLPPNIYN